jgi:hypothetical protein
MRHERDSVPTTPLPFKEVSPGRLPPEVARSIEQWLLVVSGASSCFPIFSELKESQAGACSYRNSGSIIIIHVEVYTPIPARSEGSDPFRRFIWETFPCSRHWHSHCSYTGMPVDYSFI